MTHKSRCWSRTIPVVCTAVFHHEEDGYADRGYHLVEHWQLDKFWAGDGRPVPSQRNPAVIATSPSMSLKNTMRPSGRGDMTATVKFKCLCGAKGIANSRDLRDKALRAIQQLGPEARIDIRWL